jgi:hypothetical protein
LGGALRGSQTADRQPLKPRPKFTTSACHPEPPGLPFAVPSAKLKRDGVSPSGKAADFDSAMRWFESSHPSFARGVKVAALPQRRRAAPKRNLKQWAPELRSSLGKRQRTLTEPVLSEAPLRRVEGPCVGSNPATPALLAVGSSFDLAQDDRVGSSFDGVYPERSRGAQDDTGGASLLVMS